MQYEEPFTHTGILSTFQVTEQLQLLAGVARGWDAWEDPNDDAELLAGIGWNSSDKDTSINLTLTSGDQDNGVSNTANRTLVSFVLSHNFSDCLTYVFQSDFGIQDNGTINNQFQVVPAKWYSFNQYCTTTLQRHLPGEPDLNFSVTRISLVFCRYRNSWLPVEIIMN